MPMTPEQIEAAIRVHLAGSFSPHRSMEAAVSIMTAAIGALPDPVTAVLSADIDGNVVLEVADDTGPSVREAALIVGAPSPAHPVVPEIAPEFLAWGHAEAADEAYHRAIADAGTGWGPEERSAYKPVEAARIAARRAWVAAGCPVTAGRSS